MSPVAVCFGALDALVFAQAAYVAKDWSARKAKKGDDQDPSSKRVA